jgi:hypothetical protein
MPMGTGLGMSISMKRAAARMLCALVALSVITAAGASAVDGNRILSQAAAIGGVRSYAVPASFDVRLHKPIPLRLRMDGSLYYKPPAQSALVITKRPPIIGGLFAKSYALDLVPQTWPAKYNVQSVSPASFNGVPVYELNAVPKIAGTVDHVVFQVARSNALPLSAQWFYRDRSVVAVSIASARDGDHLLPQAESISVVMPHYALDATSTFGHYAFDVPIPDAIFTTATK